MSFGWRVTNNGNRETSVSLLCTYMCGRGWVTGIKPRAWCTLAKGSATELHFQAWRVSNSRPLSSPWSVFSSIENTVYSQYPKQRTMSCLKSQVLFLANEKYLPTTSSRTSFQWSSLPFSWIMVTVILRWIPWVPEQDCELAGAIHYFFLFVVFWIVWCRDGQEGERWRRRGKSVHAIILNEGEWARDLAILKFWYGFKRDAMIVCLRVWDSSSIPKQFWALTEFTFDLPKGDVNCKIRFLSLSQHSSSTPPIKRFWLWKYKASKHHGKYMKSQGAAQMRVN